MTAEVIETAGAAGAADAAGMAEIAGPPETSSRPAALAMLEHDTDSAQVDGATLSGYSYAFLDELTKKAVRRATLKAVAVPGYQVPFGSTELPIARGWGTGGLQITLSLIGPGDTLKVIDQGSDNSVNAVSIRRLVELTAPGVDTTAETAEASIIQTRHRIPEGPLREDQILVFQVPLPEPLRVVERREAETRRMHAEADYGRIWVVLYEDVVQHGRITRSAGYPVLVNSRHVMTPSPIPKWDVPRLHQAPFLSLFGAGREKRIYAVPPYTDVIPLAFEDYPFEIEDFGDERCALCGSTETFLVGVPQADGETVYTCSDTAWCEANVAAQGAQAEQGAMEGRR